MSTLFSIPPQPTAALVSYGDGARGFANNARLCARQARLTTKQSFSVGPIGLHDCSPTLSGHNGNPVAKKYHDMENLEHYYFLAAGIFFSAHDK